MIVYGIPNCNSVKKAIVWLTENGFNPILHDFKKKGITAEKLNQWCAIFGWEQVLNKKGTTWKKLTEKQQQEVTDQKAAVRVMIANTSAIKRPIIEVDNLAVLIGFNEDVYKDTLN